MSDVVIKDEGLGWLGLYVVGTWDRSLFGVYDHDDTYGPISSLRRLYVWRPHPDPAWVRLDPGAPDDLNGPELERYLITLLRMNV